MHEFPNGEEFVRAYRALVKEFRDSPIGSRIIEEIIKKEIMGGYSNPQIYWLTYVQSLCGTQDFKIVYPFSDSINQIFSIVFAPAFFHTTIILLQDISSTIKALRSISGASINLERVMETYLLRLIDISQYVLYLDYIRSNTTYKEWGESFSKLREASP